MNKIGITTTVPIEVLIAAGCQPVDLNNILVTNPNPERLVNIAERAGFPLNCCSWIKGIYGVCLDYGIDTVICVTSGDAKATPRPSTAQKRTRSAVRNTAMIENSAMANPMQLRMSTLVIS
jgi:hypothetical protein